MGGTYEYQYRLPGGLPLLGRGFDRRTLFTRSTPSKKRKGKAHTNKLAIAHDRRVKLDLHRLCMVRRAPTHQVVTRVRNEGVPTRVPHRSLQDTLVLGRREVLQKDMFNAPETPRSECSDFRLDRSYSALVINNCPRTDT